MQVYFKDEKLDDESAQLFGSLSTYMMMGIPFKFDGSVNTVPLSNCLNKVTQFHCVFFHNLIDRTKEKCESVYMKIGSIIKLFLLNPGTILTHQKRQV